mgnify:CR=1 FL=1
MFGMVVAVTYLLDSAAFFTFLADFLFLVLTFLSALFLFFVIDILMSVINDIIDNFIAKMEYYDIMTDV